MRVLLKPLVIVAGLVLGIVPALAQDSGASGMLRFVHVLPDAPAIDIYTDGQLTITGLDYGEASGYVQVAAGAHTVEVTEAGSDTSIWEQEINSASDVALTLVAASLDPAEFHVYQDDLSPLALGSARLTAIHAIADMPALDVLLTDGRAVMPGLQFNQPYGTLDVPAATYEVAVVAEGEGVEDAVLPTETLALNSGASYMAIIYGAEGEPALLLLSTSTRSSDESGSIRFQSASVNTSVDISIDDVIVVPALSQNDPATDYITLLPGSYEVVVNADGDILVTETIEVEADQHVTLVVLSTENGAELLSFPDPVDTITASAGAVSVINTLPDDGSVSVAVGETEVLSDVVAGESDSVLLEPSENPLTATITVNGETRSFELAPQVYGGVYYSILAVSGENGVLPVVSRVSIAQDVTSAAGSSAALPTVEPEATEASDSTPEVTAPAAEAVETATPEAGAVQPTAAVTRGPTARVLVDPGANLHIRQFPTSSALSLALAPSGAVLNVEGRQGAPVLAPEQMPEPEATEYVDPASVLPSAGADLNPADTWLFVTYQPAEGGEANGWVNTLFVTVSDAAGRPQRLANLPTIPANRAGSTSATISEPSQATATPIATDSIVATVLLNEGANLHLRRNPDTAAESLARIPSGAQVIVTARTEAGDWLQASYDGQVGWIASLYVTLSLNGVTYQSAALPVLSTPTPTPTLEPTPAA